MKSIRLAALAALFAAPALAADPACERPAPPPFGLEAWRVPARRTVMAVGRRTIVPLMPRPNFIRPPEKTPDETDRGQVVTFRAAADGLYRIALSEPVWLDVLGRKGFEPSVAHDHGPPCSGIRKLVDFRLREGAYVLQLSGARAATVDVLIVPVKGGLTPG